jgi:uncharacterized protein Smg (DUF494 family)
MHQRLGELLQFIMREIAESPGRLDQSEDIRHALADKGYEQSEIDTALRMIKAGTSLRSNVENGTVLQDGRLNRGEDAQWTHRVLASWERAKLTIGAQELLLWLELEGYLWPDEREEALARCMNADAIVDEDELTSVIVWSVIPMGDPRRHQILLEVGCDPDVDGTLVH